MGMKVSREQIYFFCILITYIQNEIKYNTHNLIVCRFYVPTLTLSFLCADLVTFDWKFTIAHAMWV